DHTRNGGWLVFHDRTIDRNENDPDEQYWREETIDDRAPIKRLHRVHFKKIHHDPDQRRNDDHGVKKLRAAKSLIESLAFGENLRQRIGGRARMRSNGEQTGADDFESEK